ncbi:hypothetical protein DFS33DRAFT_1277539 [Desarmillaria ectypa]|nr:hypothetical protein DFS33DRAFT_1277539 [Desarmillaria ectypa]
MTQIETKGESAKEMKLSPPTAVVIAINAGVSKPENAIVLRCLLRYTSGAIHSARVMTFFATWDLPWDLGSYFRTTVYLNHAENGVPLDGPPESYSLKSMMLLNVSPTSRVESNLFGPNEIPCVYGPVGRGWLGYVGDVNNENGSTRVIIVMTRCLPQSAVVPDKSNRTYAFLFQPKVDLPKFK